MSTEKKEMPQTCYIKDGCIWPDSEAGIILGFTRELFGGYLWKSGDRILISLITSADPGKGNLSRLFRKIEESGFKVAVPTPLGKMISILQRKGFAPAMEYDKEMGESVEVWMKP